MQTTNPQKTAQFKAHQYKKLSALFLFSLLLSFFLTACTDEIQSPEEVAKQFWSSARTGKLDAAKQMVTWDTAGYLKYFKDDKFNIKRVDFGDVITQDSLVKIDTTLILEREAKQEGGSDESKSDIRIPTQTILIKADNVWRVELKKTLAEVINKSVNAAANQFNRMLQQGMQELNKALSGTINELGKTLEDNAKQFGDSLNQFQQELEKKLPKPKDPNPSQKEI